MSTTIDEAKYVQRPQVDLPLATAQPTFFDLKQPNTEPKHSWFARFPRSVDLSDRSRCLTTIVASLAARRSARKDDTAVVTTITELARDVGASPSHIGGRTLRYLEAEGHITRIGGGWTVNQADTGWFKFPGWTTQAGLSRNAITVLLGICSSAYADDTNGRITVTYGQLASLSLIHI